MTIGIGVLGTSETGRAKEIVADTAILIADTMGSFGDAYSHSRLHKALMFPEHNVYALVADEVDKGAELVPVICKFLAQEAPKEQRHYGNIINGIAKGCFFYKGEKFTILELPKLRLPPEVFDPRKVTPELNAVVQAEWDRFYVGCDLLIATFDGLGKAYLLSVDGQNGELHNVSFPGFGAIGCGAGNAMFWLSTRQHTLGMLPVRAAYHAYEAKLMAEGSAHVNQHLDIIVATKDEHWFSSSHGLLGGDWPEEHAVINLSNLKQWNKKYGPKGTEMLGKDPKPKSSVARKVSPRAATVGR
jgi:hypothetical protein